MSQKIQTKQLCLGSLGQPSDTWTTAQKTVILISTEK